MKHLARIGTLILGLAAQSAVATNTYPVVDTGQTSAYGNNKGQDAHYLANAPSYLDNGNGTVSDNVTGLMWTQDPGDKKTFAQAVAGATACNIGGYSDWRLPTIKELYSLIQLNGIDPDPMSRDESGLKPFIDNTVFKFTYGKEADGDRIIDSQFATSTKYVSTTMGGNETLFGVNFADGRIKGYPIQARGSEKRFYVLYVRGNTEYGQNKFKDHGDGTVTDEATGLTWMQADSGQGMDWPTALEYAEGMEFAGHTDWRLPNAKELQSIIDYTRSPDTTDSAAIDPIFEATAIVNEGGEKDFAHYWTSSTHIGSKSTDTAVYFAFGRALGFMKDRRTGETTLMDVHGAGAQRSDPKTGDAAKFPKGRGPQGDVIRIQNMVRLVRGGNAEPVEAPVVTKTKQRMRTTTTQTQPTPESSTSSAFISHQDRDGDGKVSKEEFGGPAAHFSRLDANNDGYISADEAPTRTARNKTQPAAETPPLETAVVSARMTPAHSTAGKPNIIFIYADDMGWTGSSVEMIEGNPSTKSDFYQTPNLEKLAAAGMVFSQAYAPGPMCTPSRAAVLTGKTPAELHITTPGNGKSTGSTKMTPPQIASRLSTEIPTIGTMLKQAGYATALLGKWHIGRNDHAGNHGFDLHDGSTENLSKGTTEDPKEICSLTERGIDFMQQQVKAGKPFYLQLSHYAVHSPTQSKPDSMAQFESMPAGTLHKEADFAGMTWDLDASLEPIFKALKELNIEENTYVVFMSDNGAPGNRRKPNNTPLSFGKGTLYEGGIRVPLIIAGRDVKTGYCTEPVTGTDLLATFAAWAGAEIKSDESTDLTPLLTRKSFERTNALLFHYPHYGQGPIQKPQTAVIAGSWKLLKDWETGTCQLFNLADDISEKNDLSKSNPEKVAEMMALMEQRLKETDAQLPTVNPDYDPSAQSQQRQRRN
jgi:arylsulfatase A-like enzyme